MNSLYAAIKFATPNNYYVSDISFGGEPEEAPPPAVLGNVSFLPESQVTAGFSGLTGIGVSDVSDLLNGVKSIHEFPELEYCVPIKQSHRKVEDGIYYYDLPNGIHVVGLDEQHEVLRRYRQGDTIRSVEFSSNITDSMCSTKGSKKRATLQNGVSGAVCTIHMPDPMPIIFPEALRQFFIVEINMHLLEDPSKIAKPDEGWLVLLMDKRSTTRHHKSRKS